MLPKGFLKPTNPVNQYFISTGIILWIVFSYFLYALFFIVRETIRISTADLGHQVLLILNKQETFVYNLFYAAIATTIGYMLALKFVLENSYFRSSPKNRNRIRHTLHEQGVFTWTFLWSFSIMSFCIGLTYLWVPVQFDINFVVDFPEFLVLLPIVVFMSTWPQLSRTIGYGAFKWLAVIFLIFIGNSLILSNIRYLDSDKINESLLSKSVFQSHHMQLPRSKAYGQVFRRSRYEDIYLVWEGSSGRALKIIDKKGNELDSFEQLYSQIGSLRTNLPEYEQFQFHINLIADKRIKLASIQK